MSMSPLPSRTRPGSRVAVDASLSSGRNPFSLARQNAAKAKAKAKSKSRRAQPEPEPSDEDDIEDPDEEEEDDDDDDEYADDKHDDEDEEDEDELADSPYFTQPTQLLTQPTQILKPSTSLKRTVTRSDDPIALSSVTSSSPPRSIVEVPASSPFQSPQLPAGRLASLMAPAGTAFRSPAAPPAKPKLPLSSDKDDFDGVMCIDDSSEDDSHNNSRGDIQPSSFRRPSPAPAEAHAAPAPAPASAPKKTTAPTTAPTTANVKTLNDRKMAHLIVKLQSQLRSKGYSNVTTEASRAALLRHDYSIEEAAKDLLHKRLMQSSSPVAPSVSSVPSIPSMIRSFAYQANDPKKAITISSSPNSSQASSPSSPRKRTLSPSPRPKRRRLVQGRKYQNVSSSQPDGSTQERTRLVDLTGNDSLDESDDEEVDDAGSTFPAMDDDVDDDDDDDDDVIEIDDDSAEDEGAVYDVEKRVLEYFNTCTVADLVAMLGGKAKGKAETILSHRPFLSAASVTRVRTAPTGGSRGKKTSANIGEDIFEAVREYVVALQAIDVVVAQCEQKGLRIRSTLHRWNVDFRGSSKAVREAGSGEPLTPTSEVGSSAAGTAGTADKSGYVPLPIPQEPALMRGHCTMKGYQLFGLNWLWELYQRKFGCILADDMGLGKTCQVISFLSQVISAYTEAGGREDDEAERPWPNLVIVPPSTLANWKAEFQKFAPGIRVTTYSGSVAERDQLYYKIQENRARHHVVLTSYSQLSGKQDLDAMRRMAPNVAIFDEGHKMKNANTALYKSLKRIEANWRLILTGTPVQNNLMEMINLLNFIQPKLFERHLEKLGALFSQRFTVQDVSNGALLFSDRVRRARSILEPFILQRRKEQVLSSMPKKTTRVVYCALDATQRPIYESYERQFREGKHRSAGLEAQTQQQTRSAVTGLSNDQNNVWVQLRKSAIHAQLFRRYYDDKKVEKMAQILMAEVPQSELRQPDIKHLVNELKDCSDFELHTWCRDYRCLRKYDTPEGLFLQSGKVQELLRLVQGFQERGDRALVFTRFARVLNILRECLTLQGLAYVSLEGATRVEERQAIIDEFNENADIPVFLLTTGSGGTGINLTAANKVIIFDQSDNPQDDVQAENRAHRLGQTREVEVIKLVTRGTIEELVYKACQTKLELAERVTASSSSVHAAQDSHGILPVAVDLVDGDKLAKAVEEDVRKMLLAKGSTPPKSDYGSS